VKELNIELPEEVRRVEQKKVRIGGFNEVNGISSSLQPPSANRCFYIDKGLLKSILKKSNQEERKQIAKVNNKNELPPLTKHNTQFAKISIITSLLNKGSSTMNRNQISAIKRTSAFVSGTANNKARIKTEATANRHCIKVNESCLLGSKMKGERYESLPIVRTGVKLRIQQKKNCVPIEIKRKGLAK